VRPTWVDPEVVAHLATRGLRPAVDDVGLAVVHLDEVDDLIAALARRARELVAQLAAADGEDPASAKEASDHAALRAALRLWDLPIAELRRRAALLDR